MILAEWGAGQVFWSMLWFFLVFLWVWLIILVLADIFRSHDLSGWVKAIWVIAIIVLPFLGVLAYLVVRGRSMTERTRQHDREQQAGIDAYIRETTGTSTTADELERLSDLHSRGRLNDDEYAQAKSKVVNS